MENKSAVPLLKTFWGLKNKFRAVIAIFLIAIFGIVSFVLINNSTENLTKQVTDQGKAFANLSSKPIIQSYDLYYNSGYFKFRELIKNLLDLNRNISQIQIIDTNGNLLADSKQLTQERPSLTNESHSPEFLTNLKKADPTYLYDSQQRLEEIIYPNMDDWGSQRYVVRYFISYNDVLQNEAFVRNNIILLMISFLILSLAIISWMVEKIILDPIGKVHQGARQISSGHLGYEIKITTGDEVEELAGSVNKMARSLQKNIEDLRKLDKLKNEFVTIASHNLRTPLTAIKGYLSFLTKDKYSQNFGASQQKYLSGMNANVDYLAELIEELLSVVYFESGSKGLTRTSTNLISLIQEVILNYKDVTAKKNINLNLIMPNITLPEIRVDQEKIKEAINNLIDNAVKFTHSGGKIDISLETTPEDIIVHFQDTGIGINKEELTNLFQKFHRATDIMEYNYTGEGLSLYLTKLILTAHGGKIWVESEEGKGSVFSFNLPFKDNRALPENNLQDVRS